MPFATFRGEASVGEVADRLFVRLTPRQRETAEAALLRANPGLAEIRRLPPGTVLEVPDIPALRPKATRENESPDRQVLSVLAAATNSYSEGLAARQDDDAAEVKSQVAALKSARFRRMIEKSEALRALADEAQAALEARAKDAAARRKALQTGLDRAAADLEKRQSER